MLNTAGSRERLINTLKTEREALTDQQKIWKMN